MTTVLVLNGPNLDRLGSREPTVYGTATYADLVARCEEAARECGVEVDVRQTNAEHEMLAWLHEAVSREAAVVLNAAAWTHTSVAIRDAAAMLSEPFVEVHISNIYAREEFRRVSYTAPLARGVISGLGLDGYVAAIRFVANCKL